MCVAKVPVNLLIRERRTYADYKDSKHVVIPGAAPSEKRFGTLQVCVCPIGSQPPLSLIFRGKGTVSTAETAAYDSRIKVFWQPKAWADADFVCDWCEEVLNPFIQEVTGPNFYLLMDNLGCQKRSRYINLIRDLGGEDSCGPPHRTEAW